MLREPASVPPLAILILLHILRHLGRPQEGDRLAADCAREYDTDDWEHFMVASRLALHPAVRVRCHAASDHSVEL